LLLLLSLAFVLLLGPAQVVQSKEVHRHCPTKFKVCEFYMSHDKKGAIFRKRESIFPFSSH